MGGRQPQDGRVLGQALRGGAIQDPGRVERGLRERSRRLGGDDAARERAPGPPADAAPRRGRRDRRRRARAWCASPGRSSRCPTRRPCSSEARRCWTPTAPRCGRRPGSRSAERTRTVHGLGPGGDGPGRRDPARARDVLRRAVRRHGAPRGGCPGDQGGALGGRAHADPASLPGAGRSQVCAGQGVHLRRPVHRGGAGDRPCARPQVGHRAAVVPRRRGGAPGGRRRHAACGQSRPRLPQLARLRDRRAVR